MQHSMTWICTTRLLPKLTTLMAKLVVLQEDAGRNFVGRVLRWRCNSHAPNRWFLAVHSRGPERRVCIMVDHGKHAWSGSLNSLCGVSD
jgi:hypothetical protein